MEDRKNAVQIAEGIVSELNSILSSVDPAQTDALVKAVINAERIFVAGAGRSLLMIRGFAMRLMHLGLTAYVVGETVTPAVMQGDLLIIASGSGETGTLKVIARRAKELGARLGVITIRPESSIGAMADDLVVIDASSSKIAGCGTQQKSVQPGGNSFEQSVMILCDAMIMQLLEETDIASANRQIMSLHANLE